jgi:hypothetical protein
MSEKSSTGKLVAAIGGVLLIVSLFLKWAGVDIPGSVGDALGGAAGQLGGAAQQAFEDAQKQAEDAASANAFDMFGWLPFLYIVIGALAIVPFVLDRLDMEVELPFEPSLVTLVGGLLVLGGMLMVLDGPGGTKIGGWLALLASIAITAGGLMQIGEDDDSGAVAAAPPGYAPPAAAPAAPQAAPAAPPAQAAPPAAPPAAQPPAPQQPPQPPPVG